MSRYDHAYILTPGGPARLRSFSIVAAAIAAICVLSATPVMRQLVGSPPASAKTAATAPTWDFQSRWWSGEVRQVSRLTELTQQAATVPARQASTVPESDLTFTKGYSLRLAARQATSVARPSGPSSESKFGRAATVARTAGTFARIDGAPSLHRVAATHTDALVDRPGAPDIGSHALAFGEQRPSQRGFADSQGGPFRSLFGNMY